MPATKEQVEVYELQRQGLSRDEIADRLGLTFSAVKSRLERYRRWESADSALADGARAVDADTPARLVWTKTDKDGNKSYSVLHVQGEAEGDFCEQLKEGLTDYKPLDPKLYAPRISTGKGEYFCVVDLADVHFQKLATVSETGGEYSVDIARHRVTEGTKLLLERASSFGVARILFVMGNDILHTDNGKTTTSGTSQDTDGSYFTAWKAAEHASIDAINQCAAVADTDLLHCMSNHDWRSGWALSQTIAAGLRSHSGIRATDYNLSERHRKYYGFEKNGFLLSHGDGSKEEKLAGAFIKEAPRLVAQCPHLYAILHHYHHKIAKRRGVDVFQSEKDHNSMTAIISGAPRPEGAHISFEYVRSPSAPDGWHDRNAYLNRQAVECFMYHPHEGQKIRFTEWF